MLWNIFQKKNIHVIENIKATNKEDVLVAKFGPNNISKYLQIALGNKQPKQVTIESIEIKYGENNILIPKQNLNKYFNFNKFIEFDPISNKIQTKKIEGKHIPVMALKPYVLVKLNKK